MEPSPHAQAPLTQSDSRWRPAHQKWLCDEDTAQHGERQQVQPAHTLRRVEPVPQERAAISARLPVHRDAAPEGPRLRDGVTTGGKRRCGCSREEAVRLAPCCSARRGADGGVLSVGRDVNFVKLLGMEEKGKANRGTWRAWRGWGRGWGT